MIQSIDWQKTPLLAVVTQDATTKEVLMLAWTNKEALDLSMQTGFAHYYSRSRAKLWKKGEQSGHTQKIKTIRLDCDSDALLFLVDQIGPACHTGRLTCFFKDLNTQTITHAPIKTQDEIYSVLPSLYDTILKSKNKDPKISYTASLFNKGIDEICKKLLEESAELLLAAKDANKPHTIYEASDLMYHYLVLLASQDISLNDIEQELKRRQGTSGIAEKLSRKEPK